MEKDFLGKGWSFPFGIDVASGGIEVSEYEENIRQCIGIIIGTRKGERQMLPEFGCDIHELLFSPSNNVTAQIASRAVREALETWEDRIEVLNVDASFDSGGTISIALSYQIKSTGEVEHLTQIVGS